MAPDSSWVEKLRSALTPSAKPSPQMAVLAFDAAAVMSKLLHLWRCLSDPNRLRRRPLSLPATRKLVSEDPCLLLSLARAELLDSLRLAAVSLHPLAQRCADPALRRFRDLLDDFAASGHDPHRWAMPPREMDSKARKMDRYVSATAALYRQMDELADREQYLRRLLRYSAAGGKLSAAVAALQQKVAWQREEVRRLKDASLWRRSFDSVASLLARAAFTVLARIDHVLPAPRRPDAGAGFWEANSAVLRPPPGTLGADALALRYANVIAVMERMVRSPRLIGGDARDDLYAMLPASVRARLRARLRGVGGCSATDVELAGEWKAALESIVEWLAPAAHSTLRWQAERSFERRGSAVERGVVMLTETLHLASRERAEEAVVEMLVGLNYVWRFEVEMGARAAAVAAGAAVLAGDVADVAASTVAFDYFPVSPSRLSISERVAIGSPLHCH